LTLGEEKNINQAKVFISTFGGDESWIDDYIEYKKIEDPHYSGGHSTKRERFDGAFMQPSPEPWLFSSPNLDNQHRKPSWGEILKYKVLGVKYPNELIKSMLRRQMKKAYDAQDAGDNEKATFHFDVAEELSEYQYLADQRGVDMYGVLRTAFKISDKAREDEKKSNF